MSRAFLLVLFSLAVAAAQSPSPAAKEVPVLIQMPNSHLSDFVKLYQTLSKRKVWLDAQLQFDKQLSIFRTDMLPRAEAIALIRDTLLKEGVQIREVGDSEAYLSR